MNNLLANKNTHERDENTTLDEETHIYNIKGETDYISMTTFIHNLFDKFNEDKIIDTMMSSKNWPNNKYYGQTREEIKDLWEKNKLEASTAGTKMHYDIECFYNSPSNPPHNNSPEFKYFINFHTDYKDQLEPYRTEWIVYDEDARIAGSIDMIFKKISKDIHHEDKETSSPETSSPEILEIYDWKRCKEIVKSTNFNKWSTNDLINHIPDTNFWHYSLQLNGYKYILKNKYNKQVTDLYLVCLHPNNKNENYIRIKIPDLQNEIHELFEERKRNIQK
tara:strand:+ start:173 stop:1006 length:834 start_codon:yes stop_codon:yes gene_type:complete